MVFTSANQIPQGSSCWRGRSRAIPNYGPALGEAAICCMRLHIDGTSTDREADIRKGTKYARRALRVASDDPGVLANAAFALAYFGEDLDAMMALVDRAPARMRPCR
jgi:hypothetical protein